MHYPTTRKGPSCSFRRPIWTRLFKTFGNGPPSGTAEISFYCRDIAATVAALKAKGVEFTQAVEDHGYGLVTYFRVPGGFSVQLYEPHYRK